MKEQRERKLENERWMHHLAAGNQILNTHFHHSHRSKCVKELKFDGHQTKVTTLINNVCVFLNKS